MERGEPFGPPIEIIDLEGVDQPAARVAVGGGPGPRRGLLGIVVAVIAVVAVLSAVSGSEDRPDDAAGPEPTTAAPSTTGVRRTTTTSAGPIGPIIPEAGGSILVLLGDRGRDQVAVDLATGQRTDLDVGDPWATVPASGGLVDTGSGTAIFVALPSGEQSSLGPAYDAAATERPDRIWLVEGQPGAATAARLVDPAGNVVARPVPLPGSGDVILATTRYLIVDAGVRRYRVGLDGGVVPLDGAAPLAPLDPDRALAEVCDGDARCGIGLADLDTGAVSLPDPDLVGGLGLPGPPAVDERTHRAALVQWDELRGAELVVVGSDGVEIERLQLGRDLVTTAWLPGGEILLLAAQHGGVSRWSPGRGEQPVALADVPDLAPVVVYVVSSSARP